VCDLLEPVVLRRKLESIVPAKQKVATALGGTETFAIDRVAAQYREFGERLHEFVADTSLVVNEALKKGKTVLFEGAQGTLLCVDHGLYPYGTASACVAGAATVGAGVGPQAIGRVVGVVKAFTSRVGAGPFPTQIEDETATYLRERGGGEYGTVTRRPRRLGWLDMVMLRHSARVNGLTDLAVTKIDVLGGLETVKAAKEYKRAGKRVPEFPADSFALADCKPVYEEFGGWEDLPPSEWRSIARKGVKFLPKEARAYLEWITRTLEAPIAFVSVGQGREDTIDLRKGKRATESGARGTRSPGKSRPRVGLPRRASR
jgi:adenylosuccinate synthase